MLLKCKNNLVLVWYRTGVDAKFVSRRILSLAVREYCALFGEKEKDVTFLPEGKPVFADFEGKYLSITHAGDFLAFAFGEFPLGVDAERKMEERPKLSERYFDDEEMKMDFSAVWTGREAVGKLTGVGLSDALRTHVSGDEATLDGKEYELFRHEIGEFLVTIAKEKV